MPKSSFDAWMHRVDQQVMRRVGVGAYDLADWCYRDAYDDGMSPGRAAAAAIANEMG